MASYSSFARYYDMLTENVDYKKRAEYLLEIIKKENVTPTLCADIACGTGSLTLELKKLGLDIFGVDSSHEMLSFAQDKAYSSEENILFLCQDMKNLDFYGTVNVAFSSLDSINHITSEQDVLKAFKSISLFLEEDGLFIFDVNSLYKHKYVLGNNIFIYDKPEVYCVWRNHFEEKTNRVSINLDFFGKEGNIYRKSSTRFYERAYSVDTLTCLLSQAGLTTIHVYDDLKFTSPEDKSERLIFIAKKLKNTLDK